MKSKYNNSVQMRLSAVLPSVTADHSPHHHLWPPAITPSTVCSGLSHPSCQNSYENLRSVSSYIYNIPPSLTGYFVPGHTNLSSWTNFLRGPFAGHTNLPRWQPKTQTEGAKGQTICKTTNHKPAKYDYKTRYSSKEHPR